MAADKSYEKCKLTQDQKTDSAPAPAPAPSPVDRYGQLRDHLGSLTLRELVTERATAAGIDKELQREAKNAGDKEDIQKAFIELIVQRAADSGKALYQSHQLFYRPLRLTQLCVGHA